MFRLQSFVLLAIIYFAAPLAWSEAKTLERHSFLVKTSSLNSKALSPQVRITQTFPEIGWIALEADTEAIAVEAKAKLQEDKFVAATEDNMIWRQIAVPNDRNYGLQKEALKRIEAEAAWDLSRGSSSVVIAVIDTGISANHPDLKNRLWSNPRETMNGIDDDQNGFIDDTYGWDFVKNDRIPEDGSKHGTHVAGIIGAEGNNQLGITGVNWNTSIMTLRTLDDNGSGDTETAIGAVLYAVNQGAKVINASWGGGGKSQALEDAIQFATDHGVLFVAAAGNSKTNNEVQPFYPASYPASGLLAVASSESKGSLSSFSNYGKFSVDVVAPGSNIYSTYGENGYQSLSGTSMASPMVAGIAGLMLAKDPTLTLLQLKNGLMNATVLQRGYQEQISTEGEISGRLALAQLNPHFQVWPSRATIALQDKFALATYPSGQNVRWSVSDSKLAEIDEHGVVRGLGHGQVTITATNGTSSQSVKINIVDPAVNSGCGKKSAAAATMTAESLSSLSLLFLLPLTIIFFMRRRRD